MTGLTQRQAYCPRLTDRESVLLVFIGRTVSRAGIPPTFDEMALALGLKSKSRIHRLLTQLEDKGCIRRISKLARAVELLVTVEPAEDVYERYLVLTRALKARPPPFLSCIPLHGFRVPARRARGAGDSAATERSGMEARGGGSPSGARR